MQQKRLWPKAYLNLPVDETTSSEAIDRRKKIDQYRQMRAQGLPEDLALEFIGWSRAKYYRLQSLFEKQGLKGLAPKSRRPHKVRPRQWSREEEQQVLTLRREHPVWGKATLSHILTRDHGLTLSESTVGRILSKAIRLNWIKPCAFYWGRVKPKRTRALTGHAQRWNYPDHRYKDKPGQLVQFDHMTVNLKEGRTLKEFRAVCPVTRLMVARVYSNATARNAAHFLEVVLEQMPLASIQVDGGSEFCAEFEGFCEAKGIPLIVLPPRSPQLNGCVERANRTVRQEFYSFYDGAPTTSEVNKALIAYTKLYNEIRPNRAIDMMTPLEYFEFLMRAA